MKRNNPDRLRRVIYAGISSAVTLTAAWRALRLLYANPADAAIIAGCAAVWALMRVDVRTKEERA